jgi:hypothetical protein
MRALLELMYVQCHEHIRESNRKRDQFIGFTGVLLAAYVAGYDKIAPIEVEVTSAMVVFSVIGMLVLTQYRRWHLQYVHTAVLLQRMMNSDTKPSAASVRAVWEKLPPIKSPFRLLLPIGVESVMYYAFVAITALSFHRFVLRTGLSIHTAEHPFVWNVAVWFLVACGIAVFGLRGSRDFPQNAWMFRSWPQKR